MGNTPGCYHKNNCIAWHFQDQCRGSSKLILCLSFSLQILCLSRIASVVSKQSALVNAQLGCFFLIQIQIHIIICVHIYTYLNTHGNKQNIANNKSTICVYITYIDLYQLKNTSHSGDRAPWGMKKLSRGIWPRQHPCTGCEDHHAGACGKGHIVLGNQGAKHHVTWPLALANDLSMKSWVGRLWKQLNCSQHIPTVFHSFHPSSLRYEATSVSHICRNKLRKLQDQVKPAIQTDWKNYLQNFEHAHGSLPNIFPCFHHG